MEIYQKQNGAIFCLAIADAIDKKESSEVENAVNNIVDRSGSNVLFDLGNLQYMKSRDLLLLLSSAKKIIQNEDKIVLCSLSEHVKTVFDVCGLSANIPITDSVESGIRMLSP